MYLIFPHMVNAYFAFLNRFVFPLASSLAACRRSFEYGAVRRTVNRLRSISKVRPPCSSSSICLHKSGCFAAYCASRFLSAVLCVWNFNGFAGFVKIDAGRFLPFGQSGFHVASISACSVKQAHFQDSLSALHLQNRLIFEWVASKQYAARSGRSHLVKFVFLSSTRHQRASNGQLPRRAALCQV